MKKILLSIALALCGYTLFLLAIGYLADGFSLNKIGSARPCSPKWEVSNPSQEVIDTLLSHHFYYIGRGSQCYVFESEDKDLVLKFFRQDRYRVPKVGALIRCPTFLAQLQRAKEQKKETKLKALYSSCKLAFEELYDESGLLYLHLNTTSHLNKELHLYDKLKRTYTIPSDEYAFMIQKKGEQLFPYLSRLLKTGKKQEAQVALEDLALLLSHRVELGIIDTDAVIQKNAGFRDKKALFLDVGGFKTMTRSDPNEDLWNTTAHLRTWLAKQDPDLADYFEGLLANRL